MTHIDSSTGKLQRFLESQTSFRLDISEVVTIHGDHNYSLLSEIKYIVQHRIDISSI
jgi:hypothetical protein